ncbi:hypothetical protein A2U01_0101449, partial [Trifolium medium]|nr:hypothetical protein [Trifolium medium]
DTESKKTMAEGQGTIDLDGFDSLEGSQSKSAQECIVNRLRSRKGKTTSTTTVTSAVTRKVKDPALKPVRFGP